MPTLPNMGLVTPTLNGDSGTWDDKINACFGLIDAHDHTPGKGPRIRSAALEINADVSWSGWAVTAVGQVNFQSVETLADGDQILFVDENDHELYWRTNAGINVQLTSGASINTSLVGGIVGDYSSVGAEVSYSDAEEIYTFQDQDAKWSHIAAGNVRMLQHGTTETVYVELAAPNALAAPYTATFPVALPGAQVLVQIDAAGQMVFSNTILADASITLSGTGEYKHGTKTVSQDATNGFTTTGTFATSAASDVLTATLDASGVMRIPILGLREGDRLKSIRVIGLATQEPTFAVYTQQGGVGTARAHTGTSTIVTNGERLLTIDTPYTLAVASGAGDFVHLKVTAHAGSTFAIKAICTVFDRV